MNHELQDRRGKELLSPRRLILLLVLTAVFAPLQAAFLVYVPLFGAVIELTAALAFLAGWCYGATVGGITALLGGFLIDALTGAAWSISPLCYLALALFAAFAAKRLFDRLLPYLLAALVVSLPLAALRALMAASISHFFAAMGAFMLPAVVVYLPLMWKKR